uniref:Disrupted in renal carcinoma protein 2 n=1 Tax=Sipha flava TaxID=143950 RepID=A0A2S2Q8K0_9HEMI
MNGTRLSIENYRAVTDRPMEVDLSFSDDGGDDEKNDDQMYRVPSTPRYSESSFKQFIKHPTYVPGREDRVFVVILVSLTFLVQMFSRDIWVPLFGPALTAFPAWSQTSLALIPFWNTFTGVLLMIPASIGINKYGMKTSLLCSCAVTTCGTAIRCLPFFEESMFAVHASAVFLSIGSIIAKPLTVTISTCCFRIGERNMATGILTIATMMGSAAGLLVTIELREPSFFVPMTNVQWKIIIEYIMYGCFTANIVCTLLVMVFFPQESSSSELSYSVNRQQLLPSKSFMTNASFDNVGLLYIALSYALSNAFSWPWYQMIDVTYSSMDFPQSIGVDCRFWMIVHTCSLTLSACWFADQFTGSNKLIGLTCLLLGSVCTLWFVSVMRRIRRNLDLMMHLIVAVLFAFPLSWSANSLLYELAADHAHPFPENVAVSLVESLRIILESCLYVLLAIFPELHIDWLHVFTLVAGLMGFIFLLLLKEIPCNR